MFKNQLFICFFILLYGTVPFYSCETQHKRVCVECRDIRECTGRGTVLCYICAPGLRVYWYTPFLCVLLCTVYWYEYEFNDGVYGGTRGSQLGLSW